MPASSAIFSSGNGEGDSGIGSGANSTGASGANWTGGSGVNTAGGSGVKSNGGRSGATGISSEPLSAMSSWPTKGFGSGAGGGTISTGGGAGVADQWRPLGWLWNGRQDDLRCGLRRSGGCLERISRCFRFDPRRRRQVLVDERRDRLGSPHLQRGGGRDGFGRAQVLDVLVDD